MIKVNGLLTLKCPVDDTAPSICAKVNSYQKFVEVNQRNGKSEDTCISKTMLKTGLLKLLREKPLSQITVYELCKVSEINRTTFYKYYGSQEELLSEIESDFLRQLGEELKQAITQSDNALLLVLQHLYDQRELFCLFRMLRPTHIHAAGQPGQCAKQNDHPLPTRICGEWVKKNEQFSGLRRMQDQPNPVRKRFRRVRRCICAGMPWEPISASSSRRCAGRSTHPRCLSARCAPWCGCTAANFE